MGQRLNIEIVKEGKTIANTYYHWSAYTINTLKLGETIVDGIIEIPMKETDNELLYSIRLLESTGALVEDSDVIIAKDMFKGERFAPATNRSTGIIGISERTIEETRKYEESRLTIDIGTNKVIFNTFISYHKDEIPHNEYLESHENIEDIVLVSYKDEMSFEEYLKFVKEIMFHYDEGNVVFAYEVENEEYIMVMIE